MEEYCGQAHEEEFIAYHEALWATEVDWSFFEEPDEEEHAGLWEEEAYCDHMEIEAFEDELNSRKLKRNEPPFKSLRETM